MALNARSRSNWASQISYDVVTSFLATQSDWAVLMCLHTIATKSDGLLEAAHAHIDNERYDMIECVAAGQPKLDLSARSATML